MGSHTLWDFVFTLGSDELFYIKSFKYLFKNRKLLIYLIIKVHKLPHVSPGEVVLGVWVANMGGGHQLLGETPLRKLFLRLAGKEGSLQAPALSPKPPASLPRRPSSAHLFNGDATEQQVAAWPPASLAQPGKVAGWALSKGEGPGRTRLLTSDPCCPGPGRAPRQG